MHGLLETSIVRTGTHAVDVKNLDKKALIKKISNCDIYLSVLHGAKEQCIVISFAFVYHFSQFTCTFLSSLNITLHSAN